MSDIAQETQAGAIGWEESIRLLNELPSMAVDRRTGVIGRLLRNSSTGIRGRALQMGAVLFPDDQIVGFLRNDADDVIRNAGLEMLKIRGQKAFSLATQIVRDSDPDVVLQGILLLDHIHDPRGYEHLRPILESDDTNLVQAAIIAVGHLGDARAIPDLIPFLNGDPWLQFAAVNALGDIRSVAAVPYLKGLLTNLFLAPVAAEALARIGGGGAYAALAEYWMQYEQSVDGDTILGLIAHVAEGLSRRHAVSAKLAARLIPNLATESVDGRLAAARILLAAAPGAADTGAMHVLKDVTGEAGVLPACLRNRHDLIPALLDDDGLSTIWGLQLCSRYPKKAPVQKLAHLVGTIAGRIPDSPDFGRTIVPVLLPVLKKVRDRSIAPSLLKLFVAADGQAREQIGVELVHYRSILLVYVNTDESLDGVLKLALKSLLGEKPEIVAAELLQLDDDDRRAVLMQIGDNRRVMKLVPWSEMLAASPAFYAGTAARAAVRSKLPELFDMLRHILDERPDVDIIRAAGELEDRGTLPTLVRYGSHENPLVRAAAVESLGKIGGPDARSALKKAALAAASKDARIAYRALAACATEEDDAFFREAVGNGDWYVRLACTDVLGRFQKPENLAALATLASDPVSIVAQRALSFLDMAGGTF